MKRNLEGCMDVDLKDFHKNEILNPNNSTVLMTLKSRVSLAEIDFINKVKTWEKIQMDY